MSRSTEDTNEPAGGPRLSSLRPSLDRMRAARATMVVIAVLAMVTVAQAAVAATFTGHHQEMGTASTLPSEPTAAAWADAPAQELSMERQRMAPPMGGGSVGNATVRTLTNDSHVAVRVTWRDPTRDTSLSSPENYSDAVALMLHGGSVPPISMGAVGTPVNIWYWRGSWQFTENSSMTGGMYTYPHPANETKPGRAAGNLLSKAHYDRYAQNYYAKGWGSLSTAPEQNVQATATREGDRWLVTFVRERSTSGEYDADFDANEHLYMTVAVWNGSRDEVNGQKSLSYTFTRLDTQAGTLDQQTPTSSSEGDESTATPTAGTDGPWLTRSASNAVTGLVALIVVTWLVAYRRL